MRIDTYSFAVDPEAGFRVDVHDQDAECVSVVLDRPERLNCQSPAMWLELIRLRRSLPGTTRVVVLRADGRAFSAGLDRALFTNDDPDGIRGLPRLPQEEATARIGAVAAGLRLEFAAGSWSASPRYRGMRWAAGFQLALGADIRLAADDVQFCMAEPTLGIVPGPRRHQAAGRARRPVPGHRDLPHRTARRRGGGIADRARLARRARAASSTPRCNAPSTPCSRSTGTRPRRRRRCWRPRRVARQRDQEQAEREAQYRRLSSLGGRDE